jgi:hypothetical protein
MIEAIWGGILFLACAVGFVTIIATFVMVLMIWMKGK